MIGGHGNDTLSIGGAAAAVAGFAALQEEEGGTVDGGDGNDVIIGGDNDDTEFGGAGNDLMSGGGGNDFIDSGEGNDTIDGGDGADFIRCGPGDDTVSGGAGDDTINGSDGINDYDGGADNDRFVAGDDGYGDSGTSINGGDGDDYMDDYGRDGRVDMELKDPSASLATLEDSPYQMELTFGGVTRNYTLDSIETFTLTQFDDSFLGNSSDNRVLGEGGNDFINGGGGNDTLAGGDGDDFLYAGFGAGGNETLYGGFGADQFVSGSVEELSSAFTFIEDFFRGDGDIIDLASIDANTTSEGDDSFEWIGNAGFSGVAGELGFESGTGGLEGYSIVQGDVNGDFFADFSLYVSNSNGDPTASFFVL